MEKLTALIVEDEAAVRMASAEALASQGFKVTEVADTAAALAVLKSDGDRIDAVVANVEMTGDVTGVGLARRIDARWPWIRLLMTARRLRPRNADMPAGIGFVAKPYDLKVIAVRLREMIFQRKPGR